MSRARSKRPIRTLECPAPWTPPPAIGCWSLRRGLPERSRGPFHRSQDHAPPSTLPQGEPEKDARALNMVAQMQAEAFAYCTNPGDCEAVCPKQIKLSVR